jgi:hypothetical protein
MKIKSTLYLSIYFSIIFLTGMGLFPTLGVPLSLCVIAFFIPYFGFKKVFLITQITGAILLLISLPSLVTQIYYLFETLNKMILAVHIPIVHIPIHLSVQLTPLLIYFPKFSPNQIGNFLVGNIPLMLLAMYIVSIVWEYILLKWLNNFYSKKGFYRRIQF